MTVDPVDCLNKCSAESCTDISQCKQGQTHSFFIIWNARKKILENLNLFLNLHCIAYIVKFTVCPYVAFWNNLTEVFHWMERMTCLYLIWLSALYVPHYYNITVDSVLHSSERFSLWKLAFVQKSVYSATFRSLY